METPNFSKKEIVSYKNPTTGKAMSIAATDGAILGAFLVASVMRDTRADLRTAFSTALHEAQRAGLCSIAE